MSRSRALLEKCHRLRKRDIVKRGFKGFWGFLRFYFIKILKPQPYSVFQGIFAVLRFCSETQSMGMDEFLGLFFLGVFNLFLIFNFF